VIVKNIIASLYIVVALTTTAVMMGAGTVGAQTPAGNQSAPAPNACQPTSSILGFPTWYKYVPGEVNQGKCRPVINATEDALPIGLAVFEIMLTLAGLIAVVMIFIGSFRYILSVGEPDKASSAQKTVINALIGLAITVVATRVVSFIAGRITG